LQAKLKQFCVSPVVDWTGAFETVAGDVDGVPAGGKLGEGFVTIGWFPLAPALAPRFDVTLLKPIPLPEIAWL
jgi:hypothetical protein